MAPPANALPQSLPADIPFLPPPWVFKTKVYFFTTPLKPVHRKDPVLQGLPPGSYNPEETIHPSALAPVKGSPQWKGGLTHVVIVRYEDSPIGPYDELIAFLDGFANPFEKGTSGRITNIYVNSRDSVWHGRINWNIPKHLARFEFTQTNPKTVTVKVSLPDAKEPFFAATVTDSSIPSVPLPAFLLNPFMHIVQPPLTASAPLDVEIASNNEWISMTPEYMGRWRVAYIEPSEGGNELYGDGLHYPQIKPFWIGAKFTGDIRLSHGVRYIDKDE